MGWPTASMTLLLGALLIMACSAKSAERAEAGAHGQADAGREASPQPGDAGSDGAVALDAFAMPDEGVHPPESGPPPCYGPSTCPVAQLCCAALAAEKAATSCIVAASCPAGLVEVCGKTGNETCSTGKCAEYQCKVGQVTSDIYACKEPFSHGVVCGLVPDGGFPGGDS